MEANKINRPRALLVFGAPASGKSTFSEKFAKKFGLAYFDFTELMSENGFSRKDMLVFLRELLKTRQTILIEGCLDTERERAEIRNILRNAGYEPALIWVQTDAATIRQRLKTRFRNVAKAKTTYEKATTDMEAPSDNEKPIILSGKHTFETQTKHVISGLAEL